MHSYTPGKKNVLKPMTKEMISLIWRYFMLRAMLFMLSDIKSIIHLCLSASALVGLTITTFWVNSADNKLTIFLIFVPENRIWHFMQICMKCQILSPGKNMKNISKCCLLQILPRVLSIKHSSRSSELRFTSQHWVVYRTSYFSLKYSVRQWHKLEIMCLHSEDTVQE